MENFYQRILNIRPQKIDLEQETAKAIKDYLKSVPSDVEGMCQVHAINIKQILKSKNIRAHKINSLNLGASYEHYFLLVDTGKEELILIDPTYSQFDSNGKTLINKKLNDFPAKVLCQTDKGQMIYDDLIIKGYSKVNIEGITLYLNSLEAKKNVSIDDLIIAATKK